MAHLDHHHLQLPPPNITTTTTHHQLIFTSPNPMDLKPDPTPIPTSPRSPTLIHKFQEKPNLNKMLSQVNSGGEDNSDEEDEDEDEDDEDEQPLMNRKKQLRQLTLQQPKDKYNKLFGNLESLKPFKTSFSGSGIMEDTVGLGFSYAEGSYLDGSGADGGGGSEGVLGLRGGVRSRVAKETMESVGLGFSDAEDTYLDGDGGGVSGGERWESKQKESERVDLGKTYEIRLGVGFSEEQRLEMKDSYYDDDDGGRGEEVGLRGRISGGKSRTRERGLEMGGTYLDIDMNDVDGGDGNEDRLNMRGGDSDGGRSKRSELGEISMGLGFGEQQRLEVGDSYLHVNNDCGGGGGGDKEVFLRGVVSRGRSKRGRKRVDIGGRVTGLRGEENVESGYRDFNPHRSEETLNDRLVDLKSGVRRGRSNQEAKRDEENVENVYQDFDPQRSEETLGDRLVDLRSGIRRGRSNKLLKDTHLDVNDEVDLGGRVVGGMPKRRSKGVDIDERDKGFSGDENEEDFDSERSESKIPLYNKGKRGGVKRVRSNRGTEGVKRKGFSEEENMEGGILVGVKRGRWNPGLEVVQRVDIGEKSEELGEEENVDSQSPLDDINELDSKGKRSEVKLRRPKGPKTAGKGARVKSFTREENAEDFDAERSESEMALRDKGKRIEVQRGRSNRGAIVDERVESGERVQGFSTEDQEFDQERSEADTPLYEDDATWRVGGEGGIVEEFLEDGTRMWLVGLGLGHYAPVFKIHEVDEEVLPLLTLEDLKDMGIHAVGARRKLFCSIQKLGKGF